MSGAFKAMSDRSLGHGRSQESSGWLFWFGLAMVALGIAAVVYPVYSTMAAELFVSWLLLISGVFSFFGSFSIRGTGPFFGALLLSVLSVAAGIFLLANPASGAAWLTLLVGVVFAFQGALEVSFAFTLRPNSGWVSMLISGIMSFLLAVLILAGWPAISAVTLGILFGVNFLTSGIAYMLLSRAVSSAS